MKNFGLTLFVITVIACNTFAQSVTPQVLNVSGGTYAQGNYMLDWSVGEMALVGQMECADLTHMITNGYIQPLTYDGDHLDSNRRFAADEIRIFPNPARDLLVVNYLARQKGPVELKLYDGAGRLVYHTTFTSYGYGYTQKIDMTRFTSGTYTLYLISAGIDPVLFKKSGSYKILKVD